MGPAAMPSLRPVRVMVSLRGGCLAALSLWRWWREKAVPRMSFDKVGIANVDPSIQVYVGTEVVAVSNLSGARFGLVGVADVDPCIGVSVSLQYTHCPGNVNTAEAWDGHSGQVNPEILLIGHA